MNYYDYLYDGEKDITRYEFSDADEMMVEVSKAIAFSDCCGGEVCMIVIDDREVCYTGWKPGMVYIYKYVDNQEIAWKGQFMNWEH